MMFAYKLIETDADRERACELSKSYGFAQLSGEFDDGVIVIAVRAADHNEWVGCVWGMLANKHAFLDYLSLDRSNIPIVADQETVAIGMMNALCAHFLGQGARMFHGRMYCPNGIVFDPGAGFASVLDQEAVEFLEFSSIIGDPEGQDGVPTST